ncbi:MAG: hypothetical protein HOH23_05965 [Gammaproteobacteria bacterium]|jgi:uncharacterized protein|nr:hypothetical protein [Gammaproteobacteria bacterium]
MQFMIVAYDGLDEGALNRRLAARESHIAGAIALKNAGHLIAGGAILDDAERMIGSTIYVDFASRADLDDWLQQDPYVIGDVWRDITISPIRLTV